MYYFQSFIKHTFPLFYSQQDKQFLCIDSILVSLGLHASCFTPKSTGFKHDLSKKLSWRNAFKYRCFSQPYGSR